MQNIITYEDKVALYENSDIPEINKVTDYNMNEIKSIVNGSLQGTNAMGSIVVDDVKCKNMLNKNVFSNSYLNNGVETSSPQSALFNYIQVKPNTQYTFSSSSSIRYLAIYEFNDTKTYLTTQLSENTSNYSFTTGNNTKYIRIDINKDTSAIMTQSVIDTLTPQLELGSEATTYTPYKAISFQLVSGTTQVTTDSAGRFALYIPDNAIGLNVVVDNTNYLVFERYLATSGQKIFYCKGTDNYSTVPNGVTMNAIYSYLILD